MLGNTLKQYHKTIIEKASIIITTKMTQVIKTGKNKSKCKNTREKMMDNQMIQHCIQ